jgi:hypothetical protein
VKKEKQPGSRSLEASAHGVSAHAPRSASVCARLFLLLSLLLGACNPDFTEPWEVKDPRVLALRVEIEGDANHQHSRPKLGQTFKLRTFMATPRKPKSTLAKRFDAKLELCLGIKLSNGALACGAAPGQPASLPFGGATTTVNDDELLFEGLTVPAELSMLPAPFDKIDRIALFGAVCVEGKAVRVAGKQVDKDPVTELFECTDNQGADYTDPLVFTLSILLDRGNPGDDNLQPTFACAANAAKNDACRAGVVTPGEKRTPGETLLVVPKNEKKGIANDQVMVWQPFIKDHDAALDLPWTDCEKSGLVAVHIDDPKRLIRVRFDSLDRQNYQYNAQVDGKTVLEHAREQLIIAHAVTDLGGKLERYFSEVPGLEDDAQAEIEVEYTPPGPKDDAAKGLTAGGRLVRFYFLVRDERGGVDYTTRELCLLPRAQ